MTSAAKVAVAGTGRAGTTLLMQIFTDLGLDTGYGSDHTIDDRVHAGLERGIETPDGPRIVKNPNLSRRLGALLDAGAVEIEHVIIPMRNLDVAAASRVRNTRYGSDLHTFGGLFGTSRATRQREALALLFYELMYTVVRHDLPYTLLMFPRFAEDWEYAYEKLGFLDPTIEPARWQAAVEGRVDLTLVHEEPLTRGERVKTVGGTIYTQAIGRPSRGLKRALGKGRK
jgi:hypothetical protein